MLRHRHTERRQDPDYIEGGERNTAYFNLEKGNVANNRITIIQTEEGHTVTNQADVLNEQVQFYSQLYKKKDQDDHHLNGKYITDFLGPNCSPPPLEEHDKDACDKEISEAPVAEAINHEQWNSPRL